MEKLVAIMLINLIKNGDIFSAKIRVLVKILSSDNASCYSGFSSANFVDIVCSIWFNCNF